MLTRCPHCFAWFRVRAEQLSVANGLVTCGRCEQVFNALSSLLEDSATTQRPVPPRIEILAEPAQAQVLIEAQASPPTALTFVSVVATPSVVPQRAGAAAAVITTVAAHRVTASSPLSGERFETASIENAAPRSDERIESRADDPLLVDARALKIDLPPVNEAVDSLDIDPVSTTLDELDISDLNFSAVDDHVQNVEAGAHDVPAVLIDDLVALSAAPRPAAARAIAWTLFGLALAVLAALQVAFIERQPLLVQVPAAARVIDSLCARLPCLERREAAASVRLLARDVREHPSYRDALLVNATIVNDAKTPSPYPVIDLRLRDAAGNVLSARQFQPREYLDQSIALAVGMPSDRPVYIVLELAGSASNAVSFEFTFL